MFWNYVEFVYFKIKNSIGYVRTQNIVFKITLVIVLKKTMPEAHPLSICIYYSIRVEYTFRI